MNVRVLELIQRPENISADDILVLQKEISKFPYMQSIRTLYLSAIHQFDQKNYHKELTKTAAYTTDKKILYQFINFKKETEKKEQAKFKKINLAKEQEAELPISTSSVPFTEKKPSENEPITNIGDTELESFISNKIESKSIEEADNSAKKIEIPEIPTSEIEQIIEEKPVATHPASVVGDTEVEIPILQNNKTKSEDLNQEKNIERENQIFAELAAEEEKKNEVFKTREEDLNFSKDTVLEDVNKIDESEIQPSEISFNGFDSFLPDVKFSVPAKKEESIVQENISDNTDENIPEKEKSTSDSVNINFNQIQELEINKEPVSEEEELPQTTDNQEEKWANNDDDEIKSIEEDTQKSEIHFEWKPMNFIQNPLDGHIKASEHEKSKNNIATIIEKANIQEAKPSEIIPIEEKIPEDVTKEEKKKMDDFLPEENVPEAPVEELVIKEIKEEEIIEEKEESISNIPNFVNTWQNWLKINRAETIKSEKTETIKTIEKKADVIDKFIEENPKISQLKEDANYVVKEKAEDISHLMTETLAKLYLVQKHYNKAISAYQALQEKHPERKEEFENKIQEIKELKHNR